MFFEDIVNRSAMPAMVKTLAFTQARHKVLTENIANVDTPGYATKHLDPAEFQRALREAMARGDDGPRGRLRGTSQFHEDAQGRLVVTPTEEAENILFHDHTNMRIEQQMSMLAENAMMHQTVTELYRGKIEGLLKAIRGTVR